MKKFLVAALAALSGSLLALAAPTAQAQDISFSKDTSSFLVLNGGYFDVVKGDEPAGSFGAEYRHSEGLFGVFKPMVATFGTSDGSFWIGAGVAVDVYFGDHVVLTGSFAPGYYAKGDGKDLGYPLEFRSKAELGYRFDDTSRLTLGIAHLSNSGAWSDHNPGVEVATVNYYLPLGNLFSMMK
ncbi:Lipid A 3-O-deacylase (PagL) [Tistlia consotensis]|uniref:Lipid A 3-O-deacylase (PagL) n=1 Tax=Tistlia consotensis USBA 355 TaxID=560819 RepID=A0A1Y6C5L8_9PROT|nr:acyloxyacyl hydrolase [Tistlia consotensis]SMF38498.1 Lipid A 3-O-deacylase (PagL) [Tistlia consotensis USBA 355]SNR37109.1 Lipid A 3-O-deacylase (PagL) [Tistlia consotensis]